MAALPVPAKTTTSGVSVTYQAADVAGDTFDNDGRTYVRAKNSSAGALTVTADRLTPCNLGYNHDAVLNVPAGGEAEFGPFPRDAFGSPVSLSYDAGVAGLEIALVRR